MFFRDLNPKERVALERNTSVFVAVVILESPESITNLLPSYVLIDVNEQAIFNQARLERMLPKLNKDQALFRVLRNGEAREIRVT